MHTKYHPKKRPEPRPPPAQSSPSNPTSARPVAAHALGRLGTAAPLRATAACPAAGPLAGPVAESLLRAGFHAPSHLVVHDLSTPPGQSPPQPRSGGRARRRGRPTQPTGQTPVPATHLRID